MMVQRLATTRRQDQRRPARIVSQLTILGAAAAVGIMSLGGWVLLQSQSDVWTMAQQSSANLAVALQRDIGRTIGMLDLSLQGAADAMREPGIDQVSPAIRQSAIFDRAATAEYLGSMLVLNAAGDVVASSAKTTVGVDLTDRDYFRVHREHADAGLFVSHAFYSRVRNGRPSIAFSRRRTAADGSFDGVVRAALDVEFFNHLFAKLELGEQGTVSVFRSDGQMIARHPAREGDFGRNMAGSKTFQQVAGAKSGSYVGKGADGIERLYTFRRVGELPLIVSVGLSVREIYAGWWSKAVTLAGMAGVLCAAICVLCTFFRLEVIRCLAVEAALAETAASLATLASTDSLTGLANRRAFDGELVKLHRQSLRTAKSMAVLMLDADCFKSYNDTYGHGAGDEVLGAIAGCIKRYAQRPLDCAARYGGEEFVALLPETDAAGGLLVAECIRKGVEALAMAHAGNRSGLVTVSIGVAAGVPSGGGSVDDLVKAADEMLYQAKRAGRNRTNVRMRETGPDSGDATEAAELEGV